MGKENTMLSLNSDLKAQARDYNINLSQLLEDSIKGMLAVKSGDMNERVIEIKKRELKEEEHKLIKTQSTVTGLRSEINKFNEQQEQEQQEQREQEKQKVIDSKKCPICNFVIENDNLAMDFKNKKVHKHCFLNLTPERLKELNNGN